MSYLKHDFSLDGFVANVTGVGNVQVIILGQERSLIGDHPPVLLLAEALLLAPVDADHAGVLGGEVGVGVNLDEHCVHAVA